MKKNSRLPLACSAYVGAAGRWGGGGITISASQDFLRGHNDAGSQLTTRGLGPWLMTPGSHTHRPGQISARAETQPARLAPSRRSGRHFRPVSVSPGVITTVAACLARVGEKLQRGMEGARRREKKEGGGLSSMARFILSLPSFPASAGPDSLGNRAL